jgi:hypothetical protein
MCSLGIDLDASISSKLDAIVTSNTISATGIGGVWSSSSTKTRSAVIIQNNSFPLAEANKIGVNLHARNVPESSDRPGSCTPRWRNTNQRPERDRQRRRRLPATRRVQQAPLAPRTNTVCANIVVSEPQQRG